VKPRDQVAVTAFQTANDRGRSMRWWTARRGIVNLSESRPVSPRSHGVLSLAGRHTSPCPIRRMLFFGQAVMPGPKQVTSDPEQVLDHGVNRGEPLQLGRRLEAPHLAFALPRGLMGHLGPVVRVLISSMHDGRHDGSTSSGAALELVVSRRGRGRRLGSPGVSGESGPRGPDSVVIALGCLLSSP